MTISEVAKQYDLTIDTLRYYERVGLLPPVGKNSSGFRDYKEEDCNWISFIKCMRSVGISVGVLAEYVSLFQQGAVTINARKSLLIEQRNKISFRILELQNILERLDEKIDGYEDCLAKKEQKLKVWKNKEGK